MPQRLSQLMKIYLPGVKSLFSDVAAVASLVETSILPARLANYAPGQLDWQPYGTDRAAECGVVADQVVNARSADDLLEWCAEHPS